MKKYFSLTIVYILMMILVSGTVSAYSQTDYNYEVYEDFEDGTPTNWNMGGTGTQYTITAETNDGYGGSNGCAKIVHRGTSTQTSELHIVPGRTYRISGYIKLLTDMDSQYNSNKYVSFIYMTKDGSIYKQVNHEYLPLSTTDWTYFEIDYAYDGYLRTNKPYVGDAVVDVLMRTCDPTISFLLDDFSIKVIAENGNAVTSVDVETQDAESITATQAVNFSTNGKLQLGRTVTFRWDYTNEYTGKSAVKIYIKNGDDWVGFDNLVTEKTSYSVAITKAMAGRNFKIEVLPIEADEDVAVQEVYYVTSKVYEYYPEEADEPVNVEFSVPVICPEQTKVEAEITILDGTTDVLAIIASYDENNKMQNVEKCSDFEDNGAFLEVATDNDTDKVKLFVWNSKTFEPYMEEKVLSRETYDTLVFVNATKGNDKNTGTYQAPLKTLTKAVETAGNISQRQENSKIYIMMSAEEHFTDNPIDVSSESFSGENEIIFTSYGDGQATITGGKHVPTSAWTLGTDGIYKANIGAGHYIRQLFANDIRSPMARSKGPLTQAQRVLGEYYGYISDDTFLADYARIDELEFVFEERWAEAYCSVDVVEIEEGKAVIKLDAPGAAYCFNKGDTSATLPVYYRNALELLDEEGEWYYNIDTGFLYYKPRHFEDMSTIDIVVPVNLSGAKDLRRTDAAALVSLKGTAELPVKNVTFNNVRFAYSSFQLEPTGNSGYPGAQANYARYNGGNWVMCGALNGANISDVTVKNCTFTKLGGTGLNFVGAVQNCEISGNNFYDLSATAIHVGDVEDVTAENPGEAVHPSSEIYAVKNNLISNNYIHDIGNDYKGAIGISAGFLQDTVISNNEIFDAPYSGMHLCFGWADYNENPSAFRNVKVLNNYIHEILNSTVHDGGGIYTNGATSGSVSEPSIMQGNYVKNLRNNTAAYYMDTGASYWRVTENVVDFSEIDYWHNNNGALTTTKWLVAGAKGNRIYGNYTTTDGLYWENTGDVIVENNEVYPTADWPDKAKEIINNAGLHARYRDKYIKYETINLPSEIDMSAEETVDMSALIETVSGKDEVISPDGLTVYYKSLNPSVATVNNEGVVTANSQGVATIESYILTGYQMKISETKVYVDDYPCELQISQDEINITKYSSFDMRAKVKSFLGRELDGYTIAYASSDSSVASVDNNGVVSGGTTTGTATLTASVNISGTVYEKECTVNVIGTDEGVTYDLRDELLDVSDWSDTRCFDIFQEENGISAIVPRDAVIYTGRKFSDEMLHFKMSIEADKPGTGPIIRANNAAPGDCYNININDGTGALNLRRYNDGQSTYLVSEAAPGTIKLDGTVYDVVLGAMNGENYVRIICKINGVTVIDHYDRDENRITDAGYFGFIGKNYGKMTVMMP